MPQLPVLRNFFNSPHFYSMVTIGSFVLNTWFVISIASEKSFRHATHRRNDNFSVFHDEFKKLLDVQEEDFGILHNMITFMMQDLFSLLVILNFLYWSLLMISKIVLSTVFGVLRSIEELNFRDKSWNYIIYKFIFLFGVMRVDYFDEVVAWIMWFMVLGFLQLFVQLARDRLDYLSTINTPIINLNMVRTSMLVCLGLVLAVSAAMSAFSVHVYQTSGFHVCALLSAELVLLLLRSLHATLRISLDVFLTMTQPNPMAESSINAPSINTRRRTLASYMAFKGEVSFTYYAFFILELLEIIVELSHYLHMLYWGSNVIFSVSSLGIFMHLKFLYNELQRKIKKHRNFINVITHMKKTYPLATQEEINANSDNCAICWDALSESVRKLPCGHLFHSLCLRSWLEQDTSCPTCRHVLNLNPRGSANANMARRTIRRVPTRLFGFHRNIMGSHFHFNASRFLPWLPNFSVEVLPRNTGIHTHGSAASIIDIINNYNNNRPNEQLTGQIHQMFPGVSPDRIRLDLFTTESVEETVDRILQGRLGNIQPPTPNVENQVPVANNNRANDPSPSTEFVYDPSADNEEEENIEAPVFMETANERQEKLKKRKEKMLLSARRRFLQTDAQKNYKYQSMYS